MCYFVAIAVQKPEVDVLRQALDDRIRPILDDIATAFEKDTAAFLIDLGHCACSLFVEPISPEEVERSRHSYAKKGWKEARIKRVLAERSRLGGLELGLLHRIVSAARKCGGLSLLVFWDDGATRPSGQVITVSAQELSAKPYLVRSNIRVDVTP